MADNAFNDLYNAMAKIHSIMMDMATTRKITQEHLNDYNDAQQKAGEAIATCRETLRRARDDRKAIADARDSFATETRKLRCISSIAGFGKKGIATMLEWEEPFLRAVDASMKKHNQAPASEIDFLRLQIEHVWVQQCIERDRNNISAARVQKQLHANCQAPEIKKLAKAIMQQIAAESAHIVDGIRDGLAEDKLMPRIEQHWYKVLSQKKIL